MKSIPLYICLILILLTACKRHKDQIAEHPKNLALIIGDPVDYGMDSTVMFPIGANYNPKIVKNEESEIGGGSFNAISFKKNTSTLYDKRASSEFINSNTEDFDIRNILFYDKVSGNSFPITSDTLHILSFAIHSEFRKPLIFFRIVKSDLNKDGIYDNSDAVMLYTSGLNGKQFTKITPENEHFLDYFYYPETNKILIKTSIDIDKDNKFSEKDETNFREMHLLNPQFGREIFTNSLKDSLKMQINALK